MLRDAKKLHVLGWIFCCTQTRKLFILTQNRQNPCTYRWDVEPLSTTTLAAWLAPSLAGCPCAIVRVPVSLLMDHYVPQCTILREHSLWKSTLRTRFGSIREHSQNFGAGLFDPVPNYVRPPLGLYKFWCVCAEGVRVALHTAGDTVVTPDNVHHHNTGLKLVLAKCNVWLGAVTENSLWILWQRLMYIKDDQSKLWSRNGAWHSLARHAVLRHNSTNWKYFIFNFLSKTLALFCCFHYYFYCPFWFSLPLSTSCAGNFFYKFSIIIWTVFSFCKRCW